MKFEDLNHRLGWIEVEDELLTFLFWTYPVLLAFLGPKVRIRHSGRGFGTSTSLH